ncbi:hypothetical protein COCOBI_04-1570 [Coccomyxa sp. Obi]|nr:hypothetical protein COCOBI_04-1570 [Coccomyxa sp. Obi]
MWHLRSAWQMMEEQTLEEASCPVEKKRLVTDSICVFFKGIKGDSEQQQVGSQNAASLQANGGAPICLDRGGVRVSSLRIRGCICLSKWSSSLYLHRQLQSGCHECSKADCGFSHPQPCHTPMHQGCGGRQGCKPGADTGHGVRGSVGVSGWIGAARGAARRLRSAAGRQRGCARRACAPLRPGRRHKTGGLSVCCVAFTRTCSPHAGPGILQARSPSSPPLLDEVALLLRRQSQGFHPTTGAWALSISGLLFIAFVVTQLSDKWDGHTAQYRSNSKYVYVGLYGAEDGAAGYERAADESNSGHSVSSLSPQAGNSGHRHEPGIFSGSIGRGAAMNLPGQCLQCTCCRPALAR